MNFKAHVIKNLFFWFITEADVIEGDDSMFNATPAVVGNRLLFRTNRYLYCIGSD